MLRSHKRKVKIVASVLSLAFAIVVPGCPSKSGGAGGKNILRYALQSPPTRLDPAQVEDGDTIDMLQQVFEGLVMWSDKNEVVPNIAEKWDISPDGTVYTFKLRDNVKFHNGRKLTAADLVYSFTRTLADKKSGTAMTYMNDIVGAKDLHDGKVNTLSGVKAVDDNTFQITIDKNRNYFIAKLTYPTSYVVCKEAIEANGGRCDEKSMIGTGPFKLKTYQAGYAVTLASFEDYHGGRPVIDGQVRSIINDSVSRQNKFESNEVDYTDIQRSDIDRLRKDSILSNQVREFPRANIWYLALNQGVFEPFKKKEVRQAFAMAIDKDALVHVALHDTGQRANGIVPPGVPGHDPNFKGLPFDPAKARELLAKAGYPGGKGFPKLVISFRQGYQHIPDAVLLIRNDLKQNLGIEVSTRQVEWSQFLDERRNGTMPCFHLRWAADYLDPQDFLSLMLRTGAEENKVGYSNPQFDSLCDQADVERDHKKRAALYAQAEKIAVDDAPWVCIYFLRDVELHKPYVKGIRDSLMGHLPHLTTSVAH